MHRETTTHTSGFGDRDSPIYNSKTPKFEVKSALNHKYYQQRVRSITVLPANAPAQNFIIICFFIHFIFIYFLNGYVPTPTDMLSCAFSPSPENTIMAQSGIAPILKIKSSATNFIGKLILPRIGTTIEPTTPRIEGTSRSNSAPS